MCQSLVKKLENTPGWAIFTREGELQSQRFYEEGEKDYTLPTLKEEKGATRCIALTIS